MELLPNNNLVRGNETTFYKDPSLATTTTEARPANAGARPATARAMVRTTAGAMEGQSAESNVESNSRSVEFNKKVQGQQEGRHEGGIP